MNGLEQLQRYKQAGFSDEELGTWTANKTKELSDAGFGMGEIDTYFGKPPFDPKPLVAHINNQLEEATKPNTPDGPRKPVKDFSDAFAAGFGMSVSSLLVKPPTTELAPDAPIMSRIASMSGQFLGDLPALTGGYLLGGRSPIAGTAGAIGMSEGIRRIMMDKYAKGEVTSFADFLERSAGATLSTLKGWVTGAAVGAVGKYVGPGLEALGIVSPTVKAGATLAGEIATLATMPKALEGHFPEPNDFLDAAIGLGFLKGASRIAQKIRDVYTGTAVKPNDLLSDIQKDPTIIQDLASEKPTIDAYAPKVDVSVDDLHTKAEQAGIRWDNDESFMELTKKVTGKEHLDDLSLDERQRMAQVLDQSAAIREARQAVGSRIGEAPEKPRLTWEDVYTQAFDDINPIREAVKRATFGKDMPTSEDPYRLARLSRGSFGKSRQFLEGATFDFESYANNGLSLKQIINPIKDDVEGFETYGIAKRAMELEARGITTGVPKQEAQLVVKADAKKYETAFRGLVDYQNRLAAYARDAGLLSEKAYDEMTDLNKDFIPYYRVIDPGMEGAGKPGGLKTKQPFKRIQGSERQILHPLESVIKNTYAIIAMAEKNAVGQAYVKMAKESGFPEDFIAKVQDPVKPIALREEEIRKMFDEFLTVSKQTKRTQAETTKTTTTGGVEGQVPPGKALQLVTERVKEALKARGFSQGETDQMVSRIAGGGKGADHTTIERIIREVERTVYMPELDIRLPSDAAQIWRTVQIPLKPNEIAVYESGKRQVYEVDPDVAAAFKATDVESANLLLKIASLPAKTLRAGAILSPDFIARNFAVDQLTATILSRGGYVPVLDFVRGALHLAKQDDVFQNWLKGGGANAAMVSVDQHYLQRHLFQLTKDAGLMEKSWNVMKSPLEMLRIASEFTENATRLGEFAKVTKGETTKAAIQEGAYASREVTLDFARIGAKMRAVNMIDAFSNVAMQGIDRSFRAFAEAPARTTLKVAGAVVVPSVLLWLANRNDPRYDDLHQWEKDLYWIVGTKDHLFRIRKPFELGVLFGTGVERILDAFFKDRPDAFKDFEQSILQAFLPNVTPNIAQPLIEQFSNHSLFTGSPIVPTETEGLLPEYQYSAYSTESAKALGQLMGSFPGLRERSLKDQGFIGGVARALSTPTLMENYVRAWTGGLGMYALQIADNALKESGVVPDPVMPEPTLADIPVIKAFMVRYPSMSMQPIEDFYSEYFASKRYYATMMKQAAEGDPRAEAFMSDHQKDMLQLDGIKQTLSQQAQLIQLINKNPEFTPYDQRQLIDTIFFMRNEVAKGGNEMLRELKKVQK